MALETDGNGGIIGPNQTLTPQPISNPNIGGGPGLFTVAEVRRARLANTWPTFTKPAIVASGGTLNIYTTPAGTFQSHTFTGAGSLVVSALNVPAPTATVEYFVIAGGGNSAAAGGPNPYGISVDGGGGGAGGYRTGTAPVGVATYPVSVGAAGSPSTLALASPIVSTAGGVGGGPAGSPGGSGGGGGSGNIYPAPTSGGSGNTPPTTPPQGNPGGPGVGPGSSAGGGGGAGGAGTNGAMGAGVVINAINGTPFTVSGSGSTYGGGGNIAPQGPGVANVGQPGVVIVRYPTMIGV